MQTADGQRVEWITVGHAAQILVLSTLALRQPTLKRELAMVVATTIGDRHGSVLYSKADIERVRRLSFESRTRVGAVCRMLAAVRRKPDLLK